MRPVVTVTADGRGVASHAGSRLLADLAEVTGLRHEFSDALAPVRQRRAGHDPGRVLVDLAVMLADGGEAISDLAVLRDQPDLFGAVASTATAWRVLDAIDNRALAGLRQARAVARDRFWAQRDDIGRGLPAALAAGRELPGLVLDLDASLIDVHSDKQSAAATFKGGFGYHPLLCWLDNTGEALAGRLRPGNAGANTATDHITVLDDALAQIPDAHRHGTPILIRTDGAGCSKDFLTHIRSLRDQGVQAEFSVGFTMTDAVKAAIDALPRWAWLPAIEADGELRDHAEVAELTGLLPGLVQAGWPTGMRVIVRREHPHPGAQLSLFDQHHGLRYQAFATDTSRGQLAHLEARHRAHARVEDRIREAKDTGLGRFPSRTFAINAVWLELTLAAADLIAWTQTTLLTGDLAKAEPKALRYRLLHVAARITRGQRKLFVRIADHWPWRTDLAAAFARLTTLPQPLQT
jgi:hypothetical protein